MKIDNHTHYVTSDLKSFILRGIKESVKAGEDNRSERLTVKIIYSRGRIFQRHTGYAYLNGTFMCLRIPKEFLKKESFARLVMHEYDHVIGYRHRQMDWNYNIEWSNDYEIRVQVSAVKEKIDIQMVRYERTKKLLKEKQTQLKRLQTSIRKYTKRVKYYEKMSVNKANAVSQPIESMEREVDDIE